jgi:hypothetical protein
MDTNVELPEEHKQVCVWPGTTIEKEDIPEFEKWILEEFDTRAKYLETIITKPDEKGPGGRHDVFFSIHTEDIEKFCVPKMKMGARWLEDVLATINNNKHLYPSRIAKYQCWNADNDTEEEAEANTYKICNECAAGETRDG